ncbi:hypothetical protein VPH35_035288 [Triticum aestivum]
MAIKRSADDVPASPPRPRTAKRILTTESPPPPPPYLPSEVIFGILSWLPSRSVLRFRSVCKSWQAMLSDPVFITAHHECSKKTRPSLLMVPCAYDREDLHTNENDSAFRMSFYRYRVGDVEELVRQEELPGGISLWSSPLHCDGLILISTMRQQLVVCNPATREFITLPERKHYTFTFPRVGFGRSKKYKVARFFYEENLPNSKKYRLVCRFEVLTLSTDTWRQTADPPHWIVGRTPAHVNGYIYWACVLNQGRVTPSNSFVRFSLADEEFSMVPHPPSDFRPERFVELEGQLCCVCLGFPNLELEVWTLSFGVEQRPEWSRRWATVIRRPDDLIIEPEGCRATRPPRVVFHQGMWLLTKEDDVYRYDTQTSEIKKISSGVQDTRYHYPGSQKAVVLHLTNYAESHVGPADQEAWKNSGRVVGRDIVSCPRALVDLANGGTASRGGGVSGEEMAKRLREAAPWEEAPGSPVNGLDDGCLMHIFSFLSPIPDGASWHAILGYGCVLRGHSGMLRSLEFIQISRLLFLLLGLVTLF